MYRIFAVLVALGLLGACSGRGSVRTDDVTVYQGPMVISFAMDSPWDGVTIPPEQTCMAEDIIPSTPELVVENIHGAANLILLEINDSNEPLLSSRGGLGVIGFYHDGSPTAVLKPVSAFTRNMPDHAFLEAGNRSVNRDIEGYMPPCSGGRNHLFTARIWAVKRDVNRVEPDIILDMREIELGRN
ncbi:MAG: hypothetical protein FWF01_01025 [Alphaproteobacteria bacterium]|nr:hypothetical protein [Alphaproteobacteria bacterium]